MSISHHSWDCRRFVKKKSARRPPRRKARVTARNLRCQGVNLPTLEVVVQLQYPVCYEPLRSNLILWTKVNLPAIPVVYGKGLRPLLPPIGSDPGKCASLTWGSQQCEPTLPKEQPTTNSQQPTMFCTYHTTQMARVLNPLPITN